MPTLTVSPAYHFWWKRLCFHSCDGAMPVSSPSMSMPVRAPNPIVARKRWIVSMPMSFASPKKYVSHDCAIALCMLTSPWPSFFQSRQRWFTPASVK